MGDLEVKCCVCLQPKQNTRFVLDYDDNNDQFVMKLRSVVPEIEWLEDYKICTLCIKQLNLVYEFRSLCIKLDKERREALINEKPILYNCFHCSKSFTDKLVLESHLESHSNETNTVILMKQNYRCDKCNKSYTTLKILKTHMKKCGDIKVEKPKVRVFSCEVCDLVLNYAKAVVEHCVNEHSMDRKSVKPYTCDECPMRFSTSANFIQHKKYHNGSRTHICSFCGKTYITKSDLTVHEYTHFNRRNYKCEFCDKAFNTNKNLRSHNLVVHTDSNLWKYNCKLCDRRFPLKSGYEQHMRRHAGDKRFACHICDKPFISRSEVQKHMGFHSKIKPFKCEHCDKSYKERRIYEIHLTKSHGIGNAKVPIRVKKFACNVCPSTFSDKQKLERHLCTHSGIKPYECQECDKKFTDKYYLKQHVKNVHNLEKDLKPT